ncbi:response regulator [Paenibacillus chartarius]|uniref:Response regulator n=1 Tax=Paenibacillus chartarius TaxID=747481 RepID=A0ABV6DVQ6_9BACL
MTIRVLVVDDDKLVRKGLISAMPWSEFGMEVVGEASNGEKALDYLQEHDVDLLLTDLAMPVMSGIELMRIVRKRYPRLHIVVLTLHQDFEYVQEALRLGAIDYIAKVQLERERFEEVLERISTRIAESKEHAGAEPKLERSECFTYDTAYITMRLEPNEGDEWLRSSPQTLLSAWEELDDRIWIAAGDDPAPAALDGVPLHEVFHLQDDGRTGIQAEPGSAILQLSGVRGASRKEVRQWLREYRDRELFYDFDPRTPLIALEFGRRERLDIPADPEALLSELKSVFLAWDWIYNDTVFRDSIGRLRRLRLPQTILIGLLYSLLDSWKRLFGTSDIRQVQPLKPFTAWHEVERWLAEARGRIRQGLDKPSYSPEVAQAVMKAVGIIQQELHQQLTSGDVARRVNMSRSYFSQCFRDIIGRTFNDYLRYCRIEQAKQYLLYSTKTIQWIAENTGYLDEKYFSRTFRDQTGMLPSEYRQSRRQG